MTKNMASNAKTQKATAAKEGSSKGKGLLWVLLGVFLLQLGAWSTFIFFAHKTKTQEIKVERPREAAAT